MRDDIILKLQRIIEGNDRITWDLFPEIYDGFLEADELSLAEDRMLQLVASAVQTATNDKIISTASAEKVAEYEDAFGLSASGLTLDERRQQVIDYINRSRVINETKLHELCQSLAPGFTVYEKTDPQALTLGVFTEEDDAQGHLPAVGIVDEIRPTVPQNLALYAGVDTAFDRGVVVSHAHFSALWAGLGTVERQVPRGMPVGGVLTANSDEVVEMEVPERMENGGINFTGELRPNIIPPSGVVKEYAPPLTMLFGFEYSGGNFVSGGIWRWIPYNSMLITQADVDTITAYGLEAQYAGTYGPYGAVKWSDDYEYTVIGVYTDINGEDECVGVNLNDLYCYKNTSAGDSLAMSSDGVTYSDSQTMTWRCRIAKK